MHLREMACLSGYAHIYIKFKMNLKCERSQAPSLSAGGQQLPSPAALSGALRQMCSALLVISSSLRPLNFACHPLVTSSVGTVPSQREILFPGRHLIHRDSGISVPLCLLICKDRIGNSRSAPRSAGSMRGCRSWHQEGAYQRWFPTPLSQNHCWGAYPNRVPHQGPPAGPNIRLGPHCQAWAGPAHPGVHLSLGLDTSRGLPG